MIDAGQVALLKFIPTPSSYASMEPAACSKFKYCLLSSGICLQDECQIPEAFGDALGGLLSVVACNVNITVTTVNGAAKIDNVKSGGMKPQLTQSAVAHTSQVSQTLAMPQGRMLLFCMQSPVVQSWSTQCTFELPSAAFMGRKGQHGSWTME